MHVNVGFNFFISKDLKKKSIKGYNKGYIKLTYSKKGGNYSQKVSKKATPKTNAVLAGPTNSQWGDSKDETSPKAARSHLRAAGKRSEVIYRLGRATGSHMRASQG